MPHLLHAGPLFPLLPLLATALQCVEHNGMGNFDNAMSDMDKWKCNGEQCYVERDNSDSGGILYRDCISGIGMPDGCVKYPIGGYRVVRCYCSNEDFCAGDPEYESNYPIVNTTSLFCSRENQDPCQSYECLFVGNARQCQNAVDEFTPASLWFGYIWQNTCFHHKTQSGQLESECRCNTNQCNQVLTANTTLAMAMNETFRDRPLIKCHFSFEAGGVASDKYFCIGELCALSENKGVRTCVNITDLGGAAPIKKLGLIDFDNRTYYLCDKSLCNWNGSVALASLSPTWKGNGTTLVPFDGSSSTHHQSLAILASLILFSLNF